MAAQLDPNVKDDLKTQFITREGTYRLMTLSEYSRPNRVGYTNSQSSPQVRVSIVSLPNPVITTTTTSTNGPIQSSNSSSSSAAQAAVVSNTTNGGASGDGTSCTAAGIQHNYSVALSGTSSSSIDSRLGGGMSMHLHSNAINGCSDQNGIGNGAGGGSTFYGGDRICFNFGRELYVYAFRGVKKGSELSKPIDKKFYKGTNPSCHDFNATSATPGGAPLLVGFTTGQIQLVQPQPGPREIRKLYNEERLIDKTKVTCLKWLPGSPNLFLASHSSGHLYLYNEELPCTPTAPNYQPFKMGDGYTILTCKSKSTRNPLYKWVFGTDNCCINEFCFSPCGSNLAIVSQDGFLRVFHYDTMELLGIARSYFGGFLCVCWSPDGKYIVVGGEDDLVTVWSLHERRVVARGQGHRSWVSVVAFDPYTTSYTNWDGADFSDDENPMSEYGAANNYHRYQQHGDSNHIDGFDLPSDRNSTPNSRQRPNSASYRDSLAPDKLAISYRLGSVSQDTQLCLWDITEDVLRHPLSLRQRVNSTNMNDSSSKSTSTGAAAATSSFHLNGDIRCGGGDDVKLIRPIAITTSATGFNASNSNLNKDTVDSSNNSSKNSSNSSSSKFSTANCTISTTSTPSTTGGVIVANDISGGLTATDVITANKLNSSSSGNHSSSKSSSNSIKFPNCISATKSDVNDAASAGKSLKGGSGTTAASATANNNNTKLSSGGNSTKSSDSGLSALNSLTQRLSNFNFLSDKKSSSTFSEQNHHGGRHSNHRKTSSLLKSYHNSSSSSNSNYNNHSSSSFNNASIDIGGGNSSSSFGSLKIGGNSKLSSSSSSSQHHTAAGAGAAALTAASAIVTSYDPMKLIGTQSCPRFDECPLLEPLICKKIAHERLTALIFREDCFLTACQDGFIYTWARPGYSSNVPQHMSPSPSAPPGGTVV